MGVKIELTIAQIRALVQTIDMVLSIQGSIRKGDPDYEPLQQIYKKVAAIYFKNNS
jgi:hypothetical protein